MQKGNRLRIHPQNIVDNYHLIKTHFHAEYPLYAVVKSNAYGHGLFPVVEDLYDVGQRHFAVFHAGKALLLRKKFKDIEILIIGDIPLQYVSEIQSQALQIGIFSFCKWEALLHNKLSGAHLHIMLETGLNRMGIPNIYGDKFRELVAASQNVGCQLSFYSHISAAPEGADKKRVEKQYEIFDEQVNYLQQAVKDIEYLHFYNSANLPFTNTHKYGARIGLLLYGYAPIEDQSPFPWLDGLRTAMELHSSIMQIKKVAKGEHIGYGLHYKCPTDRRIGYVPVGYADGFFRLLGNRGSILTEHGLSPVVGIVNMNLIAIDLTELERVQEGDDVIILGSNSAGSLSADNLADSAGTIAYEVLTALGNQVTCD